MREPLYREHLKVPMVDDADRAHVYIHIYVYVFMCMCMCVCVCICVCVCVSLYIYIYIYTCIYTYIYLSTHIYIYIHRIYIHTQTCTPTHITTVPGLSSFPFLDASKRSNAWGEAKLLYNYIVSTVIISNISISNNATIIIIIF